MDVIARTDDTHRELLAMLPANLFDLSDLESGVALLMGLLGSAVAEVPATVVVEDHFAQTADGHKLLVRLYRPRVAPASISSGGSRRKSTWPSPFLR